MNDDRPESENLYFGLLALALAALPILYVLKLQTFALLGIPYGHPVELACSLLLGAGSAVVPVLMVVRVRNLALQVAVVLLSLFFYANLAASLFGLPSVYTPLFGAEEFIYFQF